MPRKAAASRASKASSAAPASRSGKPYTMHVISGTHWDREWRYNFEQSLLRLGDLLDHALEVLETNPEYKCFMIDGGMVVVEDYLTARPENRARVEKLIRERRLALIPWYTLPDMFIVGPEAIVRNLLLGKRMAAEFGGALRSGYTATSYGQTSQLPQIYRGFGIQSALFYRGTNKHQMDPLTLWEGRDGSELYVIRGFDEVTRTNWYFYVQTPLVFNKPPRDLSYKYDPEDQPVHMCDERLYELDFQVLNERYRFARDRASLEKALRAIRNQALPYAIGRRILALDVDDNEVAFDLLPEMIRALNEISDDIEIIHDHFDDYADLVIEESKGKKLRRWKGEIRQTAIEPGFNGLYGMTPSSRVNLKLANDACETWLLYAAEPMAALASMFAGAEYPRRSFERAWRSMLQNHSHDCICGAAVDSVHRAMLTRFEEIRTVAQEITRRSCESLWKTLDLRGFQPGDQTITFFNPLQQRRAGVYLAVLDLPKPPATGGYMDPCSGLSAGEEDTTPGAPKPTRYDYFDIVDAEGRAVPCQILSRETVTMRIERPLDTAIGFLTDRCRVLIEAEAPPMGYATLALRPRGPRYIEEPRPGPERAMIATPEGRLENEHMRVELQPNGTFTLFSKTTGKTFRDLHLFAESGSVGNAHLDRRPLRDTMITSLGANPRFTMEESSPLRGVWRIDFTLRVPAGATDDARDRLREQVEIPISTRLILTRGARRLEVVTRIFNTARDHRVQILFPTDLRFDVISAESAFAVETRPILWSETADNSEKHYPTQPMQNFVDASDGKAGLALLTRGIREYIAFDDPRRTVGLTLLRAHRAYMTANTTMTPEEFDRYTGSHVPGDLEFHYALYPHEGGWSQGEVLDEAYDYKAPMPILQGVPKSGEAPAAQSLVEIEEAAGGDVRFAALKPSEDGGAWILRLWNPGEKPVRVKARVALPLRGVEKVRMDESETLETLKPSKGAFALTLRAAEIATLRLEL